MDFIDSAFGTERKGQGAFERGQQETTAGMDNMHGSAPVGTAPNTTTGGGFGEAPPAHPDTLGSDVKAQPQPGSGLQGTAGVGSKSAAPGYGSQY